MGGSVSGGGSDGTGEAARGASGGVGSVGARRREGAVESAGGVGRVDCLAGVRAALGRHEGGVGTPGGVGWAGEVGSTVVDISSSSGVAAWWSGWGTIGWGAGTGRETGLFASVDLLGFAVVMKTGVVCEQELGVLAVLANLASAEPDSSFLDLDRHAVGRTLGDGRAGGLGGLGGSRVSKREAAQDDSEEGRVSGEHGVCGWVGCMEWLRLGAAGLS